MELSGSGQPPGVVRALVAHALGLTHGSDATTVLTEVEQAMASVAGAGRRSRLDVRIGGGRMEIVISSNREPIWRTSRSLA